MNVILTKVMWSTRVWTRPILGNYLGSRRRWLNLLKQLIARPEAPRNSKTHRTRAHCMRSLSFCSTNTGYLAFANDYGALNRFDNYGHEVGPPGLSESERFAYLVSVRQPKEREAQHLLHCWAFAVKASAKTTVGSWRTSRIAWSPWPSYNAFEATQS
jgi:hypothetical protein